LKLLALVLVIGVSIPFGATLWKGKPEDSRLAFCFELASRRRGGITEKSLSEIDQFRIPKEQITGSRKERGKGVNSSMVWPRKDRFVTAMKEGGRKQKNKGRKNREDSSEKIRTIIPPKRAKAI